MKARVEPHNPMETVKRMRIAYRSIPLAILLWSSLQAGTPTRFHDFAHVGNGGGLRSVFLLSNQNNDQPTQVSIDFRDTAGNPMELEIEGQTTSRLELTLPALGSRTLTTSGAGESPQAGWAQLVAEREIGAQLFYEIRTNEQLVTQAAVGSSGALSAADFFVEQGNGQRVGLALANLATGATLTLRMTLRDAEGNPVGEPVERDLPPLSQIALFVDEIFDGLEDFQGTLNLRTNGSFSAVSLQQTGFVLGTVPPIEIF